MWFCCLLKINKKTCRICNRQRISILLCLERVVLYVEVLLKNSAHSNGTLCVCVCEVNWLCQFLTEICTLKWKSHWLVFCSIFLMNMHENEFWPKTYYLPVCASLCKSVQVCASLTIFCKSLDFFFFFTKNKEC